MEINKKALEIADLILKDKRDELSAQEKETLRQWLDAKEQNRALYSSLMLEQEAQQEELDFMASVNVQQAWQKVARATGQPIKEETKVIPLWQKFSTWRNVAAVLVILVMAAAVYQFKFNATGLVAPASIAAVQDKNSEVERPVLILQDGTTIDLDSLHDGTIREMNGVKVVNENGMVTFDASAAAKPADGLIAYNTIATPKGGQYQVVLPDGSKVWLNAASSLKFPAAFTGAERRVELKGEAYFDVVKDQKQFIVNTGAMDVTVLGTSFNVSAYEEDKDVSATLVTGRVRLSGSQLNGETTLTPGKRAVFSKADKRMVVSEVDTEIYTVWREGKLYFEDADLETIMVKLDRWYDVEAIYLDPASKKKTFTGVAFKDKPIEHLLSMISATTDVSFEKKGGKLFIKKK